MKQTCYKLAGLAFAGIRISHHAVSLTSLLHFCPATVAIILTVILATMRQSLLVHVIALIPVWGLCAYVLGALTHFWTSEREATPPPLTPYKIEVAVLSWACTKVAQVPP